eukprot:716467-Amorphochlora_amoeboformis.AAC.1
MVRYFFAGGKGKKGIIDGAGEGWMSHSYYNEQWQHAMESLNVQSPPSQLHPDSQHPPTLTLTLTLPDRERKS